MLVMLPALLEGQTHLTKAQTDQVLGDLLDTVSKLETRVTQLDAVLTTTAGLLTDAINVAGELSARVSALEAQLAAHTSGA